MKKSFFVFVCFLAFLQAIGQRVDLDRFSFSVNYRELPQFPLDSSFRTYDFNCQVGPLMKMAIGNESPAERLEIQGWKWLAANGHLTVQLKMEDLIITKSDISQREEIKKDKNGNVVSKKMYYSPLLTYTYAARVIIKDYTGRQIDEYQMVNRSQNFTYNGTESGSKIGAANVLLNMVFLTTQVSRDVLYRTIYQLSTNLTRQYGYLEKRVSDMVWIVANKKHPEYSRFRSNWGIVKNALFKINTNEPVGPIWEEVQPAIVYFEKIRKQYTDTDKHDRKLRYASHFILSKLYFYLDKPELAQREASDLILNDYDSRDGHHLESMANYLKNELAINNRSTRYFPLYTQSFEGPRNVSLYSGQ
jgi:hypothetical protein